MYRLIGQCKTTLRRLYLDSTKRIGNSDHLLPSNNKIIAYILNECTKLSTLHFQEAFPYNDDIRRTTSSTATLLDHDNNNNDGGEKPLHLLLKKNSSYPLLEQLHIVSYSIQTQDLIVLLDHCYSKNLKSLSLDLRHTTYKDPKNRTDLLDRLFWIINGDSKNNTSQLNVIDIAFMNPINKRLPSSSSFNEIRERGKRYSATKSYSMASISLQHLRYSIPAALCFNDPKICCDEIDKIRRILLTYHKALLSIDLPLETIFSMTTSPPYSGLLQPFAFTSCYFPCLKDINLTTTITNQQHKSIEAGFITGLSESSPQPLVNRFCDFIRTCPLLESIKIIVTPHTINDNIFTTLGHCRYLQSLSIMLDNNNNNGCYDFITPQGFLNLFTKTRSLEELNITMNSNNCAGSNEKESNNYTLGTSSSTTNRMLDIITDDHLLAISSSGYRKLKRLFISDANRLTNHGLNKFINDMHHSELEYLQLYNIRCVTKELVENMVCFSKLAYLDLNISPRSPHIDRTMAVHSLFDKRTKEGIAHITLYVKITTARGGIWPGTFDALTFVSDKYRSTMAVSFSFYCYFYL